MIHFCFLYSLFTFLIISMLQLFQNILTSTELRFPEGVLEELHPDCVDLCRSLLRQNPGTILWHSFMYVLLIVSLGRGALGFVGVCRLSSMYGLVLNNK